MDPEDGQWRPTEDESERKVLMVEYSRSARARCRRCSEKIPKSVVRVGAPIKWRGGTHGWISSWMHLECSRVEDPSSIDIERRVYGFSALEPEDQKRVLEELSKTDTPEHLKPMDPDDPSFTKRAALEPAEQPSDVTTPMLPYQLEGLGWMLAQEASDIKGGILADEMGMGKTLQAIALLVAAKPNGKVEKTTKKTSHDVYGGGPTLIVCPTSAMMQWKQEIELRTRPGALSVMVYYGARDHVEADTLLGYDVVLTTYSVLEYEFRRIVNGHKEPCEYCGRRFLPRTLKTHLMYFCGPNAKRTAKQAKTEKKSGRKRMSAKAMRKAMDTLHIGRSGAPAPTPSQIYKDLMREAKREPIGWSERSPRNLPPDHDERDTTPDATASSSTRRSTRSSRSRGSSDAPTMPPPKKRRRVKDSNESDDDGAPQKSGGKATAKAKVAGSKRASSSRKRPTKDKKSAGGVRVSKAKRGKKTAATSAKSGRKKGRRTKREFLLETDAQEAARVAASAARSGSGDAQLAMSLQLMELESESGDDNSPDDFQKRLEAAIRASTAQTDRVKVAPGRKKDMKTMVKKPKQTSVKSTSQTRPKRSARAKRAIDSARSTQASTSKTPVKTPSVPARRRQPKRGQVKRERPVVVEQNDSSDEFEASQVPALIPRRSPRRRTTRVKKTTKISSRVVLDEGKASDGGSGGNGSDGNGSGNGSSDDEQEQADDSAKDPDFELPAENGDETDDDDGHSGDDSMQSNSESDPSPSKKRRKRTAKATTGSNSRRGATPGKAMSSAGAKKKGKGGSSNNEGEHVGPAGQGRKRGRKRVRAARQGEPGWYAEEGISLAQSPLHLVSWDRIILDEAHKIKGRTNNTAKSAYALTAKNKWCLTGTPLQNRVGELYSLIRFLKMDKFSQYFCAKKDCSCVSYRWNFGRFQRRCILCNHPPMSHYSYFNKHVINPVKRYGYTGDGRKAMMTLKTEVLDQAMLRRTKKEREEDIKLPALDIKVEKLELDETERDFYECIYRQSRSRFDTYIDKGTLLHNYAHIFDLLSRLRQAVDHPYLVIHGAHRTSAAGSKRAVVSDGRGGPATSIPSRSRGLADVCGICREDIKPKDCVGTACRHTFHRKCMQQYTKEKIEKEGGFLTCPVCYDALSVTLDFRELKVNTDKPGDASALCILCLSAPMNAVLLDCGHMYTCMACAKRLRRDAAPGKKAPCPICRAPIRKIARSAQGGERVSVGRRNLMQLVRTDQFASSTKVEALAEQLRQIRATDATAKAIVFSQYSGMLDIVEWRLNKAGLKTVKLSGSLTVGQRQGVLRAFREDPTVNVILLSLKAGGEGLNLQVASHVFLLDPWWNPAVEMQAIQRAHRIGQTHDVTAVRFITKDTIEDRMLELQNKKALVFSGTIDCNAGSLSALTEQDLRFLFQN